MKPPAVDQHMTVGEAVRIRAFRNVDGRKMYAIQVGHGEFMSTFRDDGAPYSRFSLALRRAEKIGPGLDAEIERRRDAPPPEAWLNDDLPEELKRRHSPRAPNRPRRASDYINAGGLTAGGLAARIRAARRRLAHP